VDAATGEKTELTRGIQARKFLMAKDGSARMARDLRHDGQGFGIHRLSYIDLATKQPQYLTTNIPWDVEWFDLTQEGKMIAFLTNEEA